MLFPVGLTAQPSMDPILIGGTVSMEGKYREPSLMIQKGIRYWVDQVNQKGGLLGRKVSLRLYDDKSDPEQVKQYYQKLITEDRVDLVLSPYSTPLTLVASQITEKHKKLMLAIAAAADAPWERGHQYLFQLYAPATRQFIGVLDIMTRKGYKTLSVLYDDTSVFNLDIFKGIKEWAALFKLDLVLVKGYQNGERDLPGLLAEVKEVGSDGLILSAYPPDAYRLIDLLKQMNYRPPVLAMPIVPAHPDFDKKVGEMAERIMGPSQWEPVERIHFPGTKQFVEGFKAFAGHLPSFHAASAYSACQLMERAMRQTGTTDNEILRNVIAALDTVTVLGRFKVDGTGRQVGHNSFIIQWQKGKKQIVWPPKMRTAPPYFTD